MWRHLDQLFFWGIFSSLTLQKAALDCDTRRTDKLHSPTLDSETKVVTRGQNVSLICSNQNKSLQITYFLFRREKHLRTHAGKGEPMIFNLSISEDHELGPYKCKAQVSNCSMVKYSHEFNFTFVDPVITPVLNMQVIYIETDRHIILRCISFNGSLPINYTFFEKDIAISPPISTHVREPAEFNITKNNAGEREEYRCKAKNELPDHERYSQPVSISLPPGGDSCPLCLQLLLPGLLLVLIVLILILAFRILPKYKARKAMRGKTPGDDRNTALEVGLYANICENQAGKESVPGLEPRQCAPTAQDEARNDCKTGYIYSELIF